MGILRISEMYVVVALVLHATTLVSGHGNMVLPLTWHDKEMMGMEPGKRNPGCVVESLPDQDDDYDWPTIQGRTVCQQAWFTNYTFIPGEVTILALLQYLVPVEHMEGTHWE